MDLEFKLPDEVLENVPSSSKEEMVRYLATYFDSVIEDYNVRLQKRATGAFGQPLSRYERSLLKDFLIDRTIGRIEAASQLAAETLTIR